MDPVQDASWDDFSASAQTLRLDAGNAMISHGPAPLEAAKALSRQYFRVARPQLRVLAIDSQSLAELDSILESLFRASMNGAAPEVISDLTGLLSGLVDKVSLLREYRLSDISFNESVPRVSSTSQQEQQLISTIEKLVPSAAMSYRQAILDSGDATRYSYRGPANEFREALREVLDHMAPDSDVKAQPGFALEADQTQPTRRQKVRYILNARRIPRPAAQVQEDLVDVIDNKVAGITGATYTLANVGAHIETGRIELLRIRRYTLLVLSEILSIPD